MKILVTGGAGFIGSSLVRTLVKKSEVTVINVDKLTYAGHLESLSGIELEKNYFFEKGDICDSELMKEIFDKYKPDAIMHLAAESHVDRSIDGSAEFIETNIIGTHVLLETSRKYWMNLSREKKKSFRFLHVSTDEVFGSLGDTGFFTEDTSYDPRSPYSSSKASSDHLVRAWYHTYGLPTFITNCSNNYGPYQFPEKLIPIVIIKALSGEQISVYGKGDNIRDWLFVEDHAEALIRVLKKGKVGQTYNVGGHNEKTNLEVVQTICRTLDILAPKHLGESYENQIAFVKDRPGHDFRYAIDASKIKKELDWAPNETFESGIKKTILWYLQNMDWVKSVTGSNYNFERLGVKE